MQNLMGRIRRCAEDYNMICADDKIAVGVSGGKDSLSLLYLLAALRRYYPVPYELQAVTIDMACRAWIFPGGGAVRETGRAVSDQKDGDRPDHFRVPA